MTENDQRIAIAEWCGWEYCRHGDTSCWKHNKTKEESWTKNLPNYLHDLNAMHEAEEKLRNNQFYFVAYPRELFKVVSGTDLDKDGLGYFTFNFIHATAAQRAEALLRTIGKWKD